VQCIKHFGCPFATIIDLRRPLQHLLLEFTQQALRTLIHPHTLVSPPGVIALHCVLDARALAAATLI
jgi:hypothetical protein